MKLHRINALMLKNYYLTLNSLDRLFDVFYWPAVNIFLWGFTTVYLQSITNNVIWNFLLGGAILWVLTWRSSQDVAVFILEDFWSYNLYNLFSSPIKGSEVIMSTLIFGIVRSIVSFFFLIGLGLLLYSFNLFSFGVLYLPVFMMILMLFGGVLGILVSSLIFRFGQRIQILAWSTAWVIQPFSCVFYPLKALPIWAQKIAVWMPPTYVFESMRAIINHEPVQLMNLLWSIGMCAVLLAFSGWFFSISLKKARKTGLLTRYA